MVQNPVIVLGQGEIGGVFSRAFLRHGDPVIPIIKSMNMNSVAATYPNPKMVVVAVGETALDEVLSSLPDTWTGKLVLLQNELLPENWRKFDLDPTVISVWFEKKPGQDYKVIIPSPVYGRFANDIEAALATLSIPCQVLDDPGQLLHELVLKNLYILTTNIAGLKVGGNVGELWEQQQPLARQIAREVIDIQTCLTATALDADQLIEGMLQAFKGDPEHKCMGRSAAARLQNALVHAKNCGLRTPALNDIANGTTE